MELSLAKVKNQGRTSQPKSRCSKCRSLVFKVTMHSLGKVFVCTECFVRLKLKARGTSMNKYGTAEHVEKVGNKAVISKKKLPPKDLEKVLKQAKIQKIAEVTATKEGRRKQTKAVVTDADYRREDEAGTTNEE